MTAHSWTSLVTLGGLPVAFLLIACSSSSSGSSSAPEAGADTHEPVNDSGHDGLATGHDAGADSPPGDATGGDGSSAPFDATPFQPIDGGSAVLTQAVSETWEWVPFAGAKCRDGSTTGLGINFNPASTKVLIYLEGGGACFNLATCSTNPASFDETDFFTTKFPAVSDGGAPQPGNGILDRTSSNPLQDWNFIYVPYCTGDIHAGNNLSSVVTGYDNNTPQVFDGYSNVDLFLQRIVPTFAAATQVLLTGISGGGFGAAANYAHVQRAFGSIPVDLIDDSGPYMEDPYLPTCLQNLTRSVWGLDSTVGADCEGHCNDPATFFLSFAEYQVSKNPDRTFGLMDSQGDGTITEFFGYGANDCMTGVLPPAESATQFTAGLEDVRGKLAADTNVGSFYFAGTDHTSLGYGAFYTRTATNEAGTVNLTDWVAGQVAGHATNAGP